ncbi:hypothetical protein PybrP1_011791 [[Pythium] brassicae (nom. inval.)]|nr:hypothetical protein PybrP1_011791 [[Pythium] brassicae (nom. inval.)]
MRRRVVAAASTAAANNSSSRLSSSGAPSLARHFFSDARLQHAAVDVAVSFGGVRKEWRGLVAALSAFPALQNAALEVATFFTSADEIDFGLPRTFHERYALAELLGEGAFGRVHRVVPAPAVTTVTAQEHAESSNDKLDLCVKVVPKQRVVNLKDFRALQQEGRMMALLGGTLNVVHFFGAYEDDKHVYLVMEHCVGGDASERLHERTPASEPLVALYMADILHVVWQCHLLRILHGDLKLENFLFADAQESSPLKLTDFGGASFLGEHEELREVRGTPLYTAPEVLAGAYGFPSDVWSCGVILFRLLSGRFPFEQGEGETGSALLDERIRFEAIDWDAAPWREDVSPEALQLVRGLLDRDVRTRLTAEQALQHPWFAAMRVSRSPSLSRSLLDGTLVQRLQFYRSLNRFQQAAFYELARVLPPAHKQRIVVLFSELSRGGARRVGVREFAAGVRRAGYRLTRGEAAGFLRGLDLDGDGFLALDECCAALLDWGELQAREPALWDALVDRVFAALDADADGRLAVADLARLAPFGAAGAGANTASRVAPNHSFRSDLRRCFRDAGPDEASGLLSRAAFGRMLLVEPHAFAHFAQRIGAGGRDGGDGGGGEGR